MEKVILIKYGELTTKKGNRNLFIKILTKNIEEMLQNYDVNIIKNRVRMFIEVNDHKFEEVVNQLKKVFGLHSIVICERIESQDLEEIKKIAKTILEKKDFQYPLVNLYCRGWDSTVSMVDIPVWNVVKQIHFNEPGNNANLKVYTDEVKNIILPDGMVSGVIE